MVARFSGGPGSGTAVPGPSSNETSAILVKYGSRSSSSARMSTSGEYWLTVRNRPDCGSTETPL